MLCQVQASGADIKAKREYHFNSVGGVYCSCKYGTLVYTVQGCMQNDEQLGGTFGKMA